MFICESIINDIRQKFFFVKFMDISSTSNGILRCVRCESKDEIKKYHHKTPDKQIIKSGRHYTKITTFLGI